MKMSNFKVGDFVRGISDNYSITNKKMTKGKVVKIYKDIKRIEIKVLEHKTRQDVIGKEYTVCQEDFELINNEQTIVIYRKDEKTVIALDKSTGEKAEAFCHPDDTFNFKEGAKVAFNRLLGGKTKEEEKVSDKGYTVIKCDRYEVGDKVLIVDKWGDGCRQNFNGAMDKWLGKIMTVKSCGINDYGTYYHMKEDGSWYWYSPTIVGKMVPVVKRKAKVGEYIKIVKPFLSGDKYEKEDVFQVIAVKNLSVSVKEVDMIINDDEYVVLEGYKPKEVFKPYLKSKNGINYGNIGEPTDLKDVLGRKLHVGDTVEVYSIQQDGAETKVINQGERVVVCNIITGKFFIMGYRESFLQNGVLYVAASAATYKILRKRNYQEVPDSELIAGITYVKTEGKANDVF